MSRLPLLAGLGALGAALAVGGSLAAGARSASLSAAQREALPAELDRALEGFDAAKAPPAARRVAFFVTGEPEGELLDAPPSPALWSALVAWLRADSLSAEHARRLASLAAPGVAVSDWYEQGRVGRGERRRRVDALSAALVKAHRAGARVIVVADGRGAPLVDAALRTATARPDEALVDRAIALGAPMPDSPHVGELLTVWRTEGSMVVGAGTWLELRDARGGVFRRKLESEAATTESVSRVVRAAEAEGEPLPSVLARLGLAPSPVAAPAPSEPAAAPSAAARPASRTAAEASGPLPSVKTEWISKKPDPASVPSGWTARPISRPGGPTGWSIAGPSPALASALATQPCVAGSALSSAGGDVLRPDCRVSVCLLDYERKTLSEIVADPSTGKLVSKVHDSVRYGYGYYLFIKSRQAEGSADACDFYHYVVEGKPRTFDLVYSVCGKDVPACGRPCFGVYESAAHSIAPER